MVSVAAVQVPSVSYDLPGGLAKGVEVIEQAAAEGIELVVFPEAWLTGYPQLVWYMVPSNDFGDLSSVYRRMFEHSVDVTHPEFGARLGAGIVNVTPLTAEELESAALRPAEEQGIAFEPALLGQLIADVGNQPGSLPLFQYALTELFDRRTGDTLTAASYRAMGIVAPNN